MNPGITGVPRIAVLALQGGVAEHVEMLRELGAEPVPVRSAAALSSGPWHGVVLPGGESSTMDRLLRRFRMRDPLAELVASGVPVLATCAGLILLAERIEDPAPGQTSLGVLPVTVRRNAFGRQVDSSREEVSTAFGKVDAAFIRAPEVTAVGGDVRVIARRGSSPQGAGAVVAVATDQVIGMSFHPELTHDLTLHSEFVRRAHRQRHA